MSRVKAGGGLYSRSAWRECRPGTSSKFTDLELGELVCRCSLVKKIESHSFLKQGFNGLQSLNSVLLRMHARFSISSPLVPS